MTQALPRRDFLLFPLALACPPLAAALPDTQTTHAHYERASFPERTCGSSQIGHFVADLTQTHSSLLSSHYFGLIFCVPEAAPNQVALNLVAKSKDKPQYCRAVFTKTCEAPPPRQPMCRRLATIGESACLQGTSDANPAKPFLSLLAEGTLGSSNRIQTAYQYGDRVLNFNSTRQNFYGQIDVDAEVRGKTRHRFSFNCPNTQHPAFYAQKKWPRLSLEAVPNPEHEKEIL